MTTTPARRILSQRTPSATSSPIDGPPSWRSTAAPCRRRTSRSRRSGPRSALASSSVRDGGVHAARRGPSAPRASDARVARHGPRRRDGAGSRDAHHARRRGDGVHAHARLPGAHRPLRSATRPAPLGARRRCLHRRPRRNRRRPRHDADHPRRLQRHPRTGSRTVTHEAPRNRPGDSSTSQTGSKGPRPVRGPVVGPKTRVPGLEDRPRDGARLRHSSEFLSDAI
ncbi:hypothetical protein M885DRAFT_318234 [Pelagophyceae sp. CCMP2097]|nr:hypothetical protein M885DRAFT_318234 [Pelagophyceae sp. CCMP2097]